MAAELRRDAEVVGLMEIENDGTGAQSAVVDLVNGLNALGVSPRDMISILQAIKAAGALQSELELR